LTILSIQLERACSGNVKKTDAILYEKTLNNSVFWMIALLAVFSFEWAMA
jgi:hypothetical protein